MAERIHWWTERRLRSPLFLSLSLTIYLPTNLSSMYLSIYRSIYLSLSLFHLITYLPTYLPSYLSICLSVYLSICGAVSFSVIDNYTTIIHPCFTMFFHHLFHHYLLGLPHPPVAPEPLLLPPLGTAGSLPWASVAKEHPRVDCHVDDHKKCEINIWHNINDIAYDAVIYVVCIYLYMW